MSSDLKQKMAQIAQAVAAGHYRYTVHGAQQRIARGLHRQDIEATIKSGEIIEDYANHHYGPACLVLDRTLMGRVLHIVCSVKPVVDIITVYVPDPSEWSADFRTRR
jgi:Domain of unknown function (DUF4258)